MTNNHAVLWARNLTIGYTAPRRAPKVVASEISMEMYAGELVCLLGPNGAGKSTFIRTIAGMQPALAGQVWLCGDLSHKWKPEALARRLAMVLTERVDVGNMSAYELVALGRFPYTDWTGKLTAHDEEVVRWAIKATGVVELAHRAVSELSDGQRQKAMIARALAQEPELMILDEPTAFLDLPRRVEIMRLLRNLARETGRAILLSTHDLDLALRGADRIWLLPPGGPLKAGAPEELVLDDSFAATFRSEGVEFDNTTGSFKIEKQPFGRICLMGHGLPTLWTARALEREGFEVGDEGFLLPLRVEVLGQNGSTRWRTILNDVEQEHQSLSDLLTFVRQWRNGPSGLSTLKESRNATV